MLLSNMRVRRGLCFSLQVFAFISFPFEADSSVAKSVTPLATRYSFLSYITVEALD